eukprot:m.66396 g.66396  ORF g.66396 m.66396 type:complete len:201 (-) comp11803_c0_seq2:1337-1939(-)
MFLFSTQFVSRLCFAIDSGVPSKLPLTLVPMPKKPLNKKYPAGSQVCACDHTGEWYLGTVVQASNKKVLVSFNGWPPAFDEWVGDSRVRLPKETDESAHFSDFADNEKASATKKEGKNRTEKRKSSENEPLRKSSKKTRSQRSVSPSEYTDKIREALRETDDAICMVPGCSSMGFKGRQNCLRHGGRSLLNLAPKMDPND